MIPLERGIFPMQHIYKVCFFCAMSFNQDLSSWDVSQVKTMTWIFCEAEAFNKDISSWNIDQVQKTYQMFAHLLIQILHHGINRGVL